MVTAPPPLTIEYYILSSFKRLFQGQWHQWSVKKEETCYFMVASSLLSCHITPAILQGIPGRWKPTAYDVQQALKPTAGWGRTWCMMWSPILDLVWELLLRLDLMPPHTAALQCTQSSHTLRSCPLDQQAHVIHPETLTSDKKKTGTCVWVQGTLFWQELTIRLAKLCPAAAAGEPGVLKGKNGA